MRPSCSDHSAIRPSRKVAAIVWPSGSQRTVSITFSAIWISFTSSRPGQLCTEIQPATSDAAIQGFLGCHLTDLISALRRAERLPANASVFKFQTWMAPLSSPAASHCPSADASRSISGTPSGLCSVNDTLSSPAGVQSLMVSSMAAEASVSPVGDHSMAEIVPVWPSSRAVSLKDGSASPAGCQMQIALVSHAAASRGDERSQATLVIAFDCAGSSASRSPSLLRMKT